MFVETDRNSISVDLLPHYSPNCRQSYYASVNVGCNGSALSAANDVQNELPSTAWVQDNIERELSPESILEEIIRECEEIERRSSPSSNSFSSKDDSSSGTEVAPLKRTSERKKAQNRAAATRYRDRKRRERQYTLQLVAQLEATKAELTGRAERLLNEINYLRNLLSEVQTAAG